MKLRTRLSINLGLLVGPLTRLVARLRGGVWLLVLCGAAGTGRAEDGAHLGAETTCLALAPWLSTYRDASGGMTLDQARQAFGRGQFRPGQKPWPSFGFTSDAIWVRFAVRSQKAGPMLWLTELRTARMDELDWHLIRGDGRVEHLTAGNLRDKSPEMADQRYPVFPLRLAAGESAEVFLRVHSETSVHLPLRLWDPQAFIGAQAGNEAMYTAFFGYLAALILLSLVFSVFTRDRGYVIYSLSLVGVFAIYFIVTGYYVWLRLPGGRLAVHAGVILAVEYTLALVFIYLRYFLDLPATMPKLDRWIVPMIWGSAGSTVVLLLGPYHIMDRLVILQALLCGVGSLGVGVVAWRRGNRVARFYVTAWLSFWVFDLISSLQFFGWLRLPLLPEFQAMLGVVLSMTLFFVAMADRVRQIGRNLEQSQRQVLELERTAGVELQAQLRQEQLLIRDLHDGIGGLTANVALVAEMGRRQALDEQERGRFEQIAVMAFEGGSEIRNLMSSLEARDVQWPDFIDQCRRHGSLVLRSHQMDFELKVSGEPDQPGPGLFPGMSLFRIFREALTNAVKHSGASRVEAVLEFTRSSFRLTVRDNGRGMGATPGSGRGWGNMAARIEELGGSMRCQRAPGTALVFELPLPVRMAALPENKAAGEAAPALPA